MTRSAEIQATIDTLFSNMKTAEAKLSAVDGNLYVIEWNNAVLRTDGQQVRMLGPVIYADASQGFMQAEADKWNRSLPADMKHMQATVCTAREALAHMVAQNAALMAQIEKAHKQ